MLSQGPGTYSLVSVVHQGEGLTRSHCILPAPRQAWELKSGVFRELSDAILCRGHAGGGQPLPDTVPFSLHDQLPDAHRHGGPACPGQDLHLQEADALPQLDWRAHAG